MSGEKARKLDTPAKLFEAMKIKCWQDYRTTY